MKPVLNRSCFFTWTLGGDTCAEICNPKTKKIKTKTDCEKQSVLLSRHSSLEVILYLFKLKNYYSVSHKNLKNCECQTLKFVIKMAFPKLPSFLNSLLRFWKTIFIIVLPLACLPLALNGGTDSNGDDITKVNNH